MAEAITSRPITDTDEPLLRRIYASTRADEMAVVPWTEPEKAAFLKIQFEAQHKYYQEIFPDAEFSILEVNGEPIGRLYIDRREDEHRLIDIALLPEFRGKGIGGRLMRGVLDEVRQAGKLVRIHVEQNNPAMRLYKRLGFEKIEDQGVYWLMEWRP
ncbi:MAG: GNAT family N-acetyltransferase [Thermoanaerobaculia bacterium]